MIPPFLTLGGALSPRVALSAVTLLLAASAAPITAFAENPDTPARIVVTDNVVAPSPQPFGLNQLNNRWGKNSLSDRDERAGYEPFHERDRWFVDAVGSTGDGRTWFEDSSFFGSTRGDGYWDGALVRAYRPVEQSDGVVTYERVAQSTVQQSMIDRGFWPVSFGFRDSWSYNLVNSSGGEESVSFRDTIITGENEFADGRVAEWYQPTALENDATYYYSVRAVDSAGNQSSDVNVVSATPSASKRGGPRIITHQVGRISAGDRNFSAWIETTNGTPPLSYEVVGSLPPDFEVEPGMSGQRPALRIRTTPDLVLDSSHEAMFTVRIRVTDAEDRSSESDVVINPALSGLNGADDEAPAAPANVQVTELDGAVHLSWDPSASSDVVGYRVYRSRWAPEDQMGRIELADAIDLQVNDLVFAQKQWPRSHGDRSRVHDRIIHDAFAGDPLWPIWRPLETGSSEDWRSDAQMGYDPQLDISFQAHPQPVPPEFTHPGQSAARISAPAGWDYRVMLLKTDSIRDSGWYYRAFEPGKTYRFRAWVYQENVPDGQVAIEVASYDQSSSMRRSFTVPEGEWTQLVIDDWTISHWDTNRAVERINLSIEGGGTVWIDQVELYEFVDENEDDINDETPRRMTEFWKEELKAFNTVVEGSGKHPVLRYWGLQANGDSGVDFDNQLMPMHERMVSGAQGSYSLPVFLDLCLEVGADPWIIASVTLSEEEWEDLWEYLAGDSGTEYGALRIQHRDGNTTPWTDEFETIHIEADNETWNSMFSWTFYYDGAGSGATAYGRFAEMLFRSITNSPVWQTDPETFNEQVTFVVNGFNGNRNYGKEAAIAAPTAEMVDLAPYLGGWESGEYIGGDTLTDDGFQKWMVYAPWKHYAQVNSHIESRNEAAAVRDPYVLGVYEGGPGYDLPGPNNPSGSVPESYGKSLAAAMTTLDCYLFESYRGYGAQAFFGFTPGTRWTTHSMGINEGTDELEFRPQASWLGQLMRNRYASGGLVQTINEEVPTMDLPAEANQPARPNTPLIGTYAFKDDDRYAVLLFSRKLPELDGDGDYTDRKITPVTLQLPFHSASKISLHRIDNDPRSSNVPGLTTFDPENPIEIDTLELSASQLASDGTFVVNSATGGYATADGLESGIPGGALYLYVFEGASSDALPATPQLAIRRDVGQALSTFQGDVRFRIVFDRPMEGLELSDLDFSDSTADLSEAEIELESVDPVLEQSLVYVVSVSGVQGGGRIELDLPAGAVTAMDGGAASAEADGADASVYLITSFAMIDFNPYRLQANLRSNTLRDYVTVNGVEKDMAYPLSLTEPFFAPNVEQTIYGGIRAEIAPGLSNSSGSEVIPNVVLANRDGTGNYPDTSSMSFRTSGQDAKKVTGWSVLLFKKEDFYAVDTSGPVSLNSGAGISIILDEWNADGGTRRFHFVIKNSGVYYISEYTYTGVDGFDLSNFVENSQERWAPIPFTEGTSDFAALIDDIESLSFAEQSFDDVEAIGFASRATSGWYRVRGMERFQVRVVTDESPYVQFDLSSTTALVTEGLTELSISALDADTEQLSYTWEVLDQPSGSAPVFSEGNSTTGGTGLPVTNQVTFDKDGSYTFRVGISDGTDSVQSRELTLQVEGVDSDPVITTTSLPDGVWDEGYSSTVEADGGDGDLIWSLNGGALPPGVNLNSTTGEISGTPIEE